MKKQEMTVAEMFDYLVENEIATKEEVNLVTNIKGDNERTMCDILYARTGYNDFDQAKEKR